MAENDAEEGGKGGLIKKILIFGGGGILLIAIGLGVGYVVFGSSQPDPSEQIEEIIDRKMKEAEEAEAAADNATPQKQSKDSPEEEVFATIYHDDPPVLRSHFDLHSSIRKSRDLHSSSSRSRAIRPNLD